MRAASYCDVTLIYYSDTVSMDAFIITMALSARAIQHGAHRHDRRGINGCVLLRFRGRIEIDHSYGLRWSGLCCHSRHSTSGPAVARPLVVKSYNRIVVKSYISLHSGHLCHYFTPFSKSFVPDGICVSCYHVQMFSYAGISKLYITLPSC